MSFQEEARKKLNDCLAFDNHGGDRQILNRKFERYINCKTSLTKLETDAILGNGPHYLKFIPSKSDRSITFGVERDTKDGTGFVFLQVHNKPRSAIYQAWLNMKEKTI